MSLLVAGTLSFDSIETPRGPRDNQPGGSALFAASAAARTMPVRLLAVAGSDFDEPTLQRLASDGADLAGLERASGPNFRWHARYFGTGDQRETLATEFGVLADWAPQVPKTFLSSTRVFLANASPRLQTLILDQLHAPAFVALDTMGFWIERERETLLALLPRIDALLVNEDEAMLLCGCRDARASARELQRMGARLAIVKRGSRGVVAACGPLLIDMPAIGLDLVVDPTGAGDVFGGAFVAHLALSAGALPAAPALSAALAWASALASAVVEDFGLAGLARLGAAEADSRRDLLLRQALEMPG